MFHIPTILPALFSLVISQNTVCIISIPIGSWLQNVTDDLRCHTVQGHFILNEAANYRSRKLFAVFSNLTKIEGCIYVKGYTGSTNISFFSKLEDVRCNEEEAAQYNLTNVIYVLAPKLKTMGFHSLKSVVGPGEIYLSYEKEQRDHMGIRDGEQCFSKEEMIFLSNHSQFRRKMYPNCDTTDLCFRLDIQKREYFLADIPDNCTVFAGLLCLIGPYGQDDAVFQKFQNLTILIGQMQVMGTLLNRLDTIFPKLQMVYPYLLPNVEMSFVPRPFLSFRCASGILDYEHGTQYVHVGLNRFLSDMSLPSLQPIRPIDISLPTLDFLMPAGFTRSEYLPDRIQDHCSFFPQFNSSMCGAFLGDEKYPDPLEDEYSFSILDYLLMVYMTFGIILSIRAIILLSDSYVTKCLPYSRYLIIFIIAVTSLIAIENCLISQRNFTIVNRNGYFETGWISSQYLSEFSSIHLTQPAVLTFMALLVAAKHVCFVIIITCYLDTVIYSRIRSARLSAIFCTCVAFASLFLCLYFNSQLHLAIRGRRPNYSREPRHVVFMPFVMAVEFRETFEVNVPATQFLQYDDDQLDVFRGNQYLTETNGESIILLEDVPLDDMGTIFPTFCNYSDAVMAITVILFYSLRLIKFSYSNYHFPVLILLYIQLSMNRIRHYLYITILTTDYCSRATTEPILSNSDLNCYTHYDVGVPGTVLTQYIEAYMDEWTWKILKWVIGNLSRLWFPIASFYCWRFARFHYYLGAVIQLQMRKKSHANLVTANRASEFDLTPP